MIAPEVAVTVKVPTIFAVASPLTVIAATLGGDELHTTVPDISCVVLSENVPVAVNCCTVPSGNEFVGQAVGVTLMEVRVALLTVRVALEETVPKVRDGGGDGRSAGRHSHRQPRGTIEVDAGD